MSRLLKMLFGFIAIIALTASLTGCNERAEGDNTLDNSSASTNTINVTDDARAQQLAQDEEKKLWVETYYTPELGEEIDFHGLTFAYPSAPSDWRLDGMLIAFGAERTDNRFKADVRIDETNGTDAKSEPDGYFTIKYKDKVYKIDKYTDDKFDDRCKEVMKDLSQRYRSSLPKIQ